MTVMDFSPAGLADAAVLATAAKVVPVPDASLDWKLELPPGRVELVLADGRRLTAVGTNVPGNADAPMDWDAIGAKFAECAAASVRPLSAAAVVRVRGMAERTGGSGGRNRVVAGIGGLTPQTAPVITAPPSARRRPTSRRRS